MTKTQHLLVELMVDRFNQARKKYRGVGYSPREKKQAVERMTSFLTSSQWVFEDSSDGNQHFVAARRTETDFGEQSIMFIPFWPADSHCSAAAFRKFFVNAMKTFRMSEETLIQVFILPDQTREQRILKQLKFKPDAFELTGKVADGLRYLRTRNLELPKGYRIRKMGRKDLSEVLRLEKLVHSAEATSRVDLSTRKARQKMKEYYEFALKKPNRTSVVVKNGKIVALIGVFLKGKDGAIGSISVHPDHQGLGLSHILYFNALTYLKDLKCKYYLGGSTTTAVLKNAAKMGRKVHGEYWQGHLA